jgi:hypothetical protein
MQGLVLQFQILKLLILGVAIALEDVSEVVDAFGDLLMQFLELGFGALLQLLQLHLQLALLLALRLQRLLEVVDRHLPRANSTSMSSTCSFTVVVSPSFPSVRPASDSIRSFRLELCRINKIMGRLSTNLYFPMIEKGRKGEGEDYAGWTERRLNERIMALYEEIECATLANLEVARKNNQL